MRIVELTKDEHLDFINTQSSVSFLQTPAWGRIKQGWSPLSLGWVADDSEQLVGAGLVLLRKVPKVNRYLAYIPEGPTLAWDDVDATNAALISLSKFLKARGVFQIKMGPHVWLNQWRAETIKSAIAAGVEKRISQVKPDHTNQTGETLIASLRSLGWRQEASDADGFGDYQPRFVFQVDLTGQNAASIFESFNQLWRRNIRKAEKSGVTVRIATAAELPAFHECYVETATRDHFRPRPLEYFTHMYSEMKSEAPERIDLFIATHADHEGAIAATTLTQVGDHAWYSYGASTTAARDLRPSNAVQWAMLQTALERGAKTYDLRGITDTLDETDPMFGLINFKLGTGGQVIEYVGEWDLVLSPPLGQGIQDLHESEVVMSLVLNVDKSKFDNHLAGQINQINSCGASLVPVLKGNGYGFGLTNLATKVSSLGLPRIAIGTIHELTAVRKFFAGEIVVLEPLSGSDEIALNKWREVSDLSKVIAVLADSSVLSTDLGIKRVLIEGQTSMHRFGFAARDLISVAAEISARFEVLGLTLHSPISEPVAVHATAFELPARITKSNRLAEIATWINTFESLALIHGWHRMVSVSHISTNGVRELCESFSHYRFDVRSGSALWLGAPDALKVSATILAIHSLSDHTHVGYRQVDGHGHKSLLVVSGGTAHGIAMSAPTHANTLRKKAISLAEGVLQAAGRVRSPFSVGGENLIFAEPPHMQVSMLWSSRTDLEVGQQIEVTVRNTTTNFDAVVGLN